MTFQGQAIGAESVIIPFVAIWQKLPELPFTNRTFYIISLIKQANYPAERITEYNQNRSGNIPDKKLNK